MIYTKELFSFILGRDDFGDESEEEEKIEKLSYRKVLYLGSHMIFYHFCWFTK
jgi:hypothetical protein